MRKEKEDLIKEMRLHNLDTGSTAVQIIQIIERIQRITEHLQRHRKDIHSRMGLIRLVGKRRRMLRYLRRIDSKRYEQVVEKLGIRGI